VDVGLQSGVHEFSGKKACQNHEPNMKPMTDKGTTLQKHSRLGVLCTKKGIKSRAKS